MKNDLAYVVITNSTHFLEWNRAEGRKIIHSLSISIMTFRNTKLIIRVRTLHSAKMTISRMPLVSEYF
jgi:hypothetical protein